MKKIRKQFLIDPELVDALKKESDRTGASEAEIVRRALEQYLKNKSS